MSERAGGSWTARAALAAFVAGAAALLLADADYLRVISASLLVAGIILGVFAIATPEALAEEPPPERRGPE